MVYKDTSINRTRIRRSGFTLVEMMVALAVGSLVVLATGALGLFSARSFISLANYVDLDRNSRNALDHLTRDVRQVERLTASSTTNLVFLDADGTNLEYVYSPTAQTFSRVKGGVTDVLLESCDRLTFSIFQRNSIGGTYDQYPAASPATCKLVEVSWRCTRDIKGTVFNTESVQTAKIVIRKQ